MTTALFTHEQRGTGRYNPPKRAKPPLRPPVDTRAERTRETRRLLERLHPGDTVQVETEETRQRLAASYSSATIVEVGGRWLRLSVLVLDHRGQGHPRVEAVEVASVVSVRRLKGRTDA